MINQRFYIANRLFTGTGWLYDHVVITENSVITDIVSADSIDVRGKETITATTLLPAFIDLQVYGAGGKLFSEFPGTNALQLLYDHCSASGTQYFLPTVATNTSSVMYHCIDAIKEYWQKGGKGCLGIHLEGPWINPAKRGAHIESLIHSPAIEEVKPLLEYGKGVIKMITLAPEVCDPGIIQYILGEGIVISAGHSNASYEQAMAAFDNGISTATHLYNAMSGLQHRSPGLVGACFNHTKAMAAIIPDGHHVDYAAISIAKKIMQERLFLITDAVTETTTGYYQHELAGDKYESNGILSGSALTMAKAVSNMVQHGNTSFEEAIRMSTLYPAQVLKMDNVIGRISKGYNASFVDWDTLNLPA